MPGKLWTSCPHCGRGDLRIRPENVGKRVACKHCGRSFVAREAHDEPSGGPLSRAPHPGELAPAEGPGQEVVELRAVLRRLRDEFGARTDERDAAVREAGEARDRLGLMAGREHELLAELDRARGGATTRGEARGAETPRVEAGRLAAELDASLAREGRLKATADDLERALSEAVARLE